MRYEAQKLHIKESEESLELTKQIKESIRKERQLSKVLEALFIILLYAFGLVIMFYAGTIYGS